MHAGDDNLLLKLDKEALKVLNSKLAFMESWHGGGSRGLKLHYMMIQMLTAPMPVTVKLGADNEEGQAVELQGSVTRMVPHTTTQSNT